MPGTNTFIQFDPALANMESDAEYAADTTRQNGGVTDGLIASPMFNKALYQVSTAVTALMQALANKGYSVSDANLSNLVAVLSNIVTTADLSGSIVSIPYATSVLFDAGVSSQFDLILTGDVANSTLVNAVPGQHIVFVVAQDAIGGRSFTWPPNVVNHGTISGLPNAVSVQTFVVRPDGTLVPATPLLQSSASLIVTPLPTATRVSAGGYISSAAAETFEEVDASAGSVTRNLFTAIGCAGFKVNVKKVDSTPNQVSVQALWSQTIDGVSRIVVTRQNDSVSLISDGTNWAII